MAEVVPPDALSVALAELPPSLALKVRDSYAQEFQRVAELEKQARALVVTDESQTVEMKMAGVLRCHLVKLRTGIDKKRKSQNEDARAWTLANNGAANAVIGVIALLESHLRDQETFGERRAAERKAELHASRTAQLVALGVDPKVYAFENASDQAFADVLADVRALQAAKAEAARLAEVARLEAERAAAAAQEAERLERARQDAERLERERAQAEENARLKAEAEEREKVVEAERKARRVEQAERDRRDALAAEALRIEREAAAAIAKAEREERDRVEARLASEREAERQAAAHAAWVAAEANRLEREKIEAIARKAKEENEAILRRIADQEHRAKLEAAAEKERAEALAEEARLAPDREKLKAYAQSLLDVRVPVLSTKSGLDAMAKVLEQVTKLVAGIRRLAGGL